MVFGKINMLGSFIVTTSIEENKFFNSFGNFETDYTKFLEYVIEYKKFILMFNYDLVRIGIKFKNTNNTTYFKLLNKELKNNLVTILRLIFEAYNIKSI
jgi:hypothetical protein